ncbi:MAG: sulfoxide reductase heme-binding subunit YedZ [Xanthomonadales bacterium]|jgi:sulfoxide reductase heme-binding subunit YedZ|nr:sulfoxide reductase heme-binding subunit YedZ [Xanthomonadales bacterium]MDH3924714.1 sulfoxide reductase heme-binding subunit YedZ [Xanthomonadales bacterium]MDH3939906.1 sulfoxide reductase heme-binding subunit YedZ [Xanthomonadales bacterium]MDH4000611.1 sulfoxide reductase heme-binding subunit YedZ [Xanthomonadales bacterium]
MDPGSIRLAKILLFLLCLVPLGKLGLETFGIAGMSLGANPVETLLHRLGIWGLNFLLITLAVTPLRFITGKNWLIRFRRMLGLFAFFYVLMHFMVYAGLDQRFDLQAIFEDIAERPYITIGFAALLLLVPLAITSTNGMMRRLGRRWQKLHRLVYLVAMLGVWHFYWQVKLDTLDASLYALVLAFLLTYRLWRKYGRTAHT